MAKDPMLGTRASVSLYGTYRGEIEQEGNDEASVGRRGQGEQASVRYSRSALRQKASRLTSNEMLSRLGEISVPVVERTRAQSWTTRFVHVHKSAVPRLADGGRQDRKGCLVWSIRGPKEDF